MDQLSDFVAQHGGAVIFAIILLDQLGLPLPGSSIVLVLGALAGTGRIDPVAGLLLGLAACLTADLAWYQLGRRRGPRILGLLCKISLEPDSCVSRTRDFFVLHGTKSLLLASFIPGFDALAAPLAGMTRVGIVPFASWSVAGAFLWLGSLGGLGYFFSDRLARVAGAAKGLETTLACVLVGSIVGYIAWKYLARRRLLRSLRMARISPEELHRMLTTGRAPTIIDARSKSALDAIPFVIQGAQLLTVEDIDQHRFRLSADREVVVYCSCPNEISSARLALKLQRQGLHRVRPLIGGIEAWRASRLPVVPR
jgi:membrane protein DedA with SNARE-associated domain/rhodanese-related sulfurtransferase